MSSFIILFIARGRKRKGEWGVGGGVTRQVLVQAVEGREYGDLPHPLPLLKRPESFAVTQKPNNAE